MKNLIKEYGTIQAKVNQLVDAKQHVNKSLRVRQMQILQQLDDEFVKSGDENIAVYQVRIRYNSMLKFLAEEIGLPVEKYINNLKDLSHKMGLGDEDWLLKD